MTSILSSHPHHSHGPAFSLLTLYAPLLLSSHWHHRHAPASCILTLYSPLLRQNEVFSLHPKEVESHSINSSGHLSVFFRCMVSWWQVSFGYTHTHTLCTHLRFVSRCCRNCPSWLQALTRRFGSLSVWMMRLMASNSTAFLALECWTFFDFGGSCALLSIVSRHSVSLFLTAASSVVMKAKPFKLCVCVCSSSHLVSLHPYVGWHRNLPTKYSHVR